MSLQNLEDLLKMETYLFSDEDPLQELVDGAIAKLLAEGRKLVVTKIFAENPMWLGQKVTVPDDKGGKKVIAVQFVAFESAYRLDIEYYYPAEVSEF